MDREVFELTLSDWAIRIESASGVPNQEGWEKVDHVLRIAFDFFRENPEFIRMMRREALDDQGHLGVDRSEEHTSELQSLMRISYAVFCLKKQTNEQIQHIIHDEIMTHT